MSGAYRGSGLVGVGAGADGASHRAADGDGAACATRASANTVRSTITLGCGDTGHTFGDGDVAARSMITAANTSRM